MTKFDFGELVKFFDEKDGKEVNSIFLFKKEGMFAGVYADQVHRFINNKSFQVGFWKHAEKIPAKTEMTKDEFKEKFGVEYDNLIVK